MDIRVSTILAAEKVAKTKKLLKLTVDTGIDKREIVSGIAEYYTEKELVRETGTRTGESGTARTEGHLSRGMILMAQGRFGQIQAVTA